MTLPSFLFGMLISVTISIAFHLWRGGSLGQLIFYLIMGVAGFWVGQFLAAWLGITFLSYGPLYLGVAIPVCLLFLLIARWLGKTTK
jgi:hypothetical protein